MQCETALLINSISMNDIASNEGNMHLIIIVENNCENRSKLLAE